MLPLLVFAQRTDDGRRTEGGQRPNRGAADKRPQGTPAGISQEWAKSDPRARRQQRLLGLERHGAAHEHVGKGGGWEADACRRISRLLSSPEMPGSPLLPGVFLREDERAGAGKRLPVAQCNGTPRNAPGDTGHWIRWRPCAGFTAPVTLAQICACKSLGGG